MSLAIVDLPWWGYLLTALALTHVTIVSVTVFLHRHQAHRALDLHPAVSHFFRLWLWLTTGMVTREWVAVHRKHHARVETADDPHSPQVHGISRVLWGGALLYRQEAARRDTLEKFGHGTPDDLVERAVYSRLPTLGPVLMLAIDGVLFGPAWGFAVWAVQMLWIPFWAAGVINGIGHYAGYRNFETRDASRNIVPWGVVIGGEELHNNHHAYASSARFSARPFEFDIGWLYISMLKAVGLARVNRLMPRIAPTAGKPVCDLETANAFVANRLQVMSDFARHVVNRVYREELSRVRTRSERGFLRKLREQLRRSGAQAGIGEGIPASLRHLRTTFPHLHLTFEMKARLQEIWNQAQATPETVVHLLEEWCQQAEQSGIAVLEEFSARLRSYTLVGA